MGKLERAHVFIVQSGLILILQQSGGARWWEIPGGELEGNEGPDSTVEREALEETGISLETPVLLRDWWYENRRGQQVHCWAYIARALDAGVVLSPEHTEYRWISLDVYEREHCQTPTSAPEWIVRFLDEMRLNCQLARAYLLAPWPER